MSPTPDLEAGLRRAALALHALNPADRRWLLHQLPSERRRRLRMLLAELRELKLPADRGFIREALRVASDAKGHATEVAERRMGAVLACEPVAAQRLLLATLTSARRQAVRRSCPPEVILPEPAEPQTVWTPTLQQAVLQSWETLATGRGA